MNKNNSHSITKRLVRVKDIKISKLIVYFIP